MIIVRLSFLIIFTENKTIVWRKDEDRKSKNKRKEDHSRNLFDVYLFRHEQASYSTWY